MNKYQNKIVNIQLEIRTKQLIEKDQNRIANKQRS